jgi:hypothetical protein
LGDGGDAEKVYETWLTPGEAIKLCAHLDRRLAISTIFDRLKSGLIRSRAKTLVVRNNPQHFVNVSIEAWQNLTHALTQDVWINGDMSVELRRDGIRYETTTFSFFGVRLDPAGINDIPGIQKRAAVTQVSAHEKEPEEKGPPISDAHLRQWLALYEAVYTGTKADTLENALNSARGMFPGKFVSRDRVRDVLPARKRGRKGDELGD